MAMTDITAVWTTMPIYTKAQKVSQWHIFVSEKVLKTGFLNEIVAILLETLLKERNVFTHKSGGPLFYIFLSWSIEIDKTLLTLKMH